MKENLFNKNYFVASCISIFLLLFWFFFLAPNLRKLPNDFKYEAEIFSTDNFYNSASKKFLGEQISKTKFSYQVIERKSGDLIVENIFDVRKLSGEKIFAVERLYAVNPITHKHVPGLGDRAREGYLFAPYLNLERKAFAYWHINYDTPATLHFKSRVNIDGLDLDLYEANFHADQTKNLDFLPLVPEERGVGLEVKLETWIEPFSGYMVQYQDHSVAYYYDMKTSKEIEPWNSFHNEYSGSSLSEHVKLAKQAKTKVIILEFIIPVLLSLFTLLFVFRTFVPAANDNNSNKTFGEILKNFYISNSFTIVIIFAILIVLFIVITVGAFLI